MVRLITAPWRRYTYRFYLDYFGYGDFTHWAPPSRGGLRRHAPQGTAKESC